MQNNNDSLLEAAFNILRGVDLVVKLSEDGISDADIEKIKKGVKVKPNFLVKLADGPDMKAKEFASGLYGDLHATKDFVYTGKEILKWLKSLE